MEIFGDGISMRLYMITNRNVQAGKPENKPFSFWHLAIKTNAVDVGGFLVFTAQQDSMLCNKKEFRCLKQPHLPINSR